MSGPEQRSAPMSLGLRALEVARSQLGVREAGDNGGDDVARYLAPCVRGGRRVGITSGVPWCAAFASWCVWEAYPGNGPGFPRVDPTGWIPGEHAYGGPPIGYRISVRELIEDARATGSWRDVTAAEGPLAGDLLCYGRDGQDPRHGGVGHVAICESWGPVFACISGNDLGEVRRRTWLPSEAPPWEPWVGWIRLG